jgi:hypothetical protein
MKLLKRIFVALLIILTFNLYLPKITFAGQVPTKHPLEIRSTPEEDIPTETLKKTSGWTWVILLALIGGAAAAASGGEDGGEDGSDNGGDNEGAVTVTW